MRKEQREKEPFESDLVSEDIHLEVPPAPMSNPENIINDKFNITP